MEYAKNKFKGSPSFYTRGKRKMTPSNKIPSFYKCVISNVTIYYLSTYMYTNVKYHKILLSCE